ncbi:hypothetical protein [Thauera sp. 2A1]|uniref:hypothetical protein n=1 Tax=Thauera sp. 2A1 TaxID=2570191 RepID=UPI001D175CA9|nr:hypothetical protein [Thauera sp. 2A1]KAI5916003.1 hypothetical protein GH664_05085 [Thauera sp. 2A1]
MMRKLLPALLCLSLAGAAHAGASTVLGGAIGGGVGAAVGEAVGGRDGAVIGGALGGGVGAAVGSNAGRERVREREVVRYEDRRYYDDHHRHRHERGYFCPPGQAKKGNC